jgi:tetratricopeptide (TPR) repeat protein
VRSGIAPRLLLLIAPLLAVELLLRLLGYGGQAPLFIDSPGRPGYREANPEVITRYYRDSPDLAIDAIPFRAERRDGGLRIVVQGASSAAGFPYGRWAGLAGMLGDRLEATFPGREIEVVTTAMAAVNSYTQLDLVDEIIEIRPDAVLIYLGHNEYLGIMGVGSSLTGAGARAVTLMQLRLGKLGLYQLVQQLVSTGRSATRSEAEGKRGTLMAHAASSALIPYGSAVYSLGVEQFQANLSDMLEAYARADVPVFVGTLASNESGLAPFSGGMGDEGKGGDSADTWFAQGQRELERGRLAEARAAFLRAKDLDALRFRAPEIFNTVIRELADQHGATVVDVQRRLSDASAGGIIGDTLMLEHVHPTADGYFLLAAAFYDALRETLAVGAIGDWSAAPSFEQARDDMPVTAIDHILADFTIQQVTSDVPFVEVHRPVHFPTPTNTIERLALQRHLGELDWLQSMERLYEIHVRGGQLAEASVVARMVAQAFPTLAVASYSAGAIYAERGEWTRARRYLERGLELAPDDTKTIALLAEVELVLGNRAAARALLDRLSRLAPNHPAKSELRARLNAH